MFFAFCLFFLVPQVKQRVVLSASTKMSSSFEATANPLHQIRRDTKLLLCMHETINAFVQLHQLIYKKYINGITGIT